MQLQHIAITLGALWLLTLIALPLLASVVSRRAKESGFAAGLAQREADHTKQIAALNADVDALAKERLDEQRTHARTSEQRLEVIAELEARIMSYTGLAVTKADYEYLKNAAETLRLARNTWQKLQGTEPWCKRAYDECQGLLRLATRIHSELRKAPATAATVMESTNA
ncbi:hypothetical protein G3435_07040 [Pseudomonas sp. MAFF212428]|uniref:Uncharacterized protein n=1 Tax=Pseudomonas brassicae TaxID=2708063 RepID=A0A6B3NU08_9PSED|nr:hypothetical protein [Pseudomonas brassicae]NER59805.1 hypothetical protein [Pseudomonas brassicae]NER65426.1 hypothetical protein [Pseudomonas brassicae]